MTAGELNSIELNWTFRIYIFFIFWPQIVQTTSTLMLQFVSIGIWTFRLGLAARISYKQQLLKVIRQETHSRGRVAYWKQGR